MMECPTDRSSIDKKLEVADYNFFLSLLRLTVKVENLKQQKYFQRLHNSTLTKILFHLSCIKANKPSKSADLAYS